MVLTAEKKKQLKIKGRSLEPMVRIGKSGLTDNAVMQVKRLLVKRKLVKVKFLRSFLETADRKKAGDELAARTTSEIVDRAGFVVVLYRR